MLSQDEIDSLLSSLSVGKSGAAQPQAVSAAGGTALATDQSSMEAASEAASRDTLSEILQQEKQRNYKLYNFRRPDKFSKEHLRALQSIHENFCRQFGLILTTYLRMGVEVDVVSVDQLTYDEFVRSMPRPMTISILEFAPLPDQLLFGLGYEVTMSIIDRMLGGPGVCNTKPRELTDIEMSLIKRVIERANQSLEEAWRSMLPVQVSQVGLEENYSLVQVASPGEIVALVTFEITLSNSESGLASLCIPYPVVEGVMGELTSQHIFNKRQEEGERFEEELLLKMQHASIPASVIMAGTQIKMQELWDLQAGDVVKLDRDAGQELLLCVNNKPKFLCRPGTRKNKLAVAITNSVSDVESLRGFALEDPARESKDPNLTEWDGMTASFDNNFDSLI